LTLIIIDTKGVFTISNIILNNIGSVFGEEKEGRIYIGRGRR
jgi:hypothetical protein